MLVKCSLAADCGNDRCDHVVKHEPEIYRGVLCNVGAVRCPYRRKQVQCLLNKQFQKVSEDGRKRLRHCLDEDIKNKRRVE